MAAKVEIYTSALCGFCTAAKRLLDSKNIDYTEIDVTFDRPTRQAMTERATAKPPFRKFLLIMSGLVAAMISMPSMTRINWTG